MRASSSASPAGRLGVDRRFEERSGADCDLWMIDHNGSTVLRCHCLETSSSGMRLRVPLGYGVAEGQRYELRSHLPGKNPRTPGFGLIGSRWATIVRTEMHLEDAEEHIEVGVVLDDADALIRQGRASAQAASV